MPFNTAATANEPEIYNAHPTPLATTLRTPAPTAAPNAQEIRLSTHRIAWEVIRCINVLMGTGSMRFVKRRNSVMDLESGVQGSPVWRLQYSGLEWRSER
jgi:hypothetical protein